MKYFKNFLKGFLIVLVLINVLIIVSGKTYLYKGIGNTYLKGRKGPSIDEYSIFSSRVVASGKPQPWPMSVFFNKEKIPSTFTSDFMKYESVAYLIIKDDSLRHEEYWGPYNDTSHTNSFSMAKTIISILTGVALQEGKIKSVDQPIGDFLPEFREGEKSKISIRHLLTMSSGINFDENYSNPMAYPAAAYYGDDLEKLTLKYEAVDEPGKFYKYLSGNTQLLGFVLEKATGMKISEYASEKLWKPMGAEHPAYWSLDRENGHEKTFCCFHSNARDFARIGELYLKKGNWKGEQLVPQEHAEASVKPILLPNENASQTKFYGYSWWLVEYKNHSIFYARGILGQYIFAIPDKNMIVVRLGKKREKENADGHPPDIFIYLDAALKMYPEEPISAGSEPASNGIRNLRLY